jgi:hypothetical protein
VEKPTWTPLTSRRWAIRSFVILLLCALGSFDAYKHFHDATAGGREALLRFIPSDSNATLFVDFAELRSSPFAAELYKWIPKLGTDPEYTQFIHDTGFDYERDLQRLAITSAGAGSNSFFLGVAQGNFDRQRIENYATRIGSRGHGSGIDFFSVPLEEKSSTLYFAFLNDSRILVTDSPNVTDLARPTIENSDSREWKTHFVRLAGSPLFMVVRQSPGSMNILGSQASSGFQSPQLSALLAQLQWITVAGKPDGGALKIVAEGESISEQTIRQLADLLNGMLLMAQAGLNGSPVRQQLDPQVRDAYLELARSADVSRIDRGDTKSVRVVIDVAPAFLEVAGHALPRRVPNETPASAHPEDTKPAKRSRSKPNR